jgi:hypothetical protein
LSFAAIDWQSALLAGAALALAGGGGLAWWRSRPRDPEEIERQRRSYLNQVGRIVEGRILEIIEAPASNSQSYKRGVFIPKRRPPLQRKARNGARTLVFYSYSISGVTYETAQDVTGLEQRAWLERVAAGQPASVKYDPTNPGNSILVADNWSGLR